jgi:delta24-sterol reductase
VSEAIPIAEYCFRYDRGGFWVRTSAFEYFAFPFNDFTRWWLDDFNYTRMFYTALHASGQSKTYIVQDLGLPLRNAKPFIDYTVSTFKIWPLWLCPLKQSPQLTIHPNDAGEQGETPSHMLNIGLWGPGPKNHDAFVALNRDLESKLRKLGGMKWLYAHTYYEEEDFWKVYPREWYTAQSLPTVYEKVKVDLEAEKQEAQTWGSTFTGTWPVGGFWALKKAIDNGTYLQNRNSVWRSRK